MTAGRSFEADITLSGLLFDSGITMPEWVVISRATSLRSLYLMAADFLLLGKLTGIVYCCWLLDVGLERALGHQSSRFKGEATRLLWSSD